MDWGFEMSRPAIKPWGSSPCLNDAFQAFGWLVTLVFGGGAMSTVLALQNDFPLPWYPGTFFRSGGVVTSGNRIVQVSEYLRTHSIERAFRLKNVSAGSLGEDTASAGKIR